MLDKMMQMFSSPQAQEAMFRLMAQQVAQAPPEKRAAMAKVEIAIAKKLRTLTVSVGESDDSQITEIINNSLSGCAGMLAKMYQMMGFKVKLYE